MTVEDVNKIIQKDQEECERSYSKIRSEFHNKVHEENIPKGFQDMFGLAIIKNPARLDNIPTAAVKKMMTTPIGELNNGEVGKMLDVITLAPRDLFCSSLDEYYEKFQPLELLQNSISDKLQILEATIEEKRKKDNETLHRKRISLYNQPGTNGGNAAQNQQKEKTKKKEQHPEVVQ